MTLTPSLDFLTIDGTILSLLSEDFDDVGTYEFTLELSPTLYAEYLTPASYPFTVTIDFCEGICPCQFSPTTFSVESNINLSELVAPSCFQVPVTLDPPFCWDSLTYFEDEESS